MTDTALVVKSSKLTSDNLASIMKLLISDSLERATSLKLFKWMPINVRKQNGKLEKAILHSDGRVEDIEFSTFRKHINTFMAEWVRISRGDPAGTPVSVNLYDLNTVSTNLWNDMHLTLTIPECKIADLKFIGDECVFYRKKICSTPVGTLNPDTRLFRPEIYNFDAMCAFFGVVLSGGPVHQYLWIQGLGGTGKTSLLKAFCKFLNDDLHVWQNMSHVDKQFFTQDTFEHRLCVLDEGSSKVVDVNNFKRLVSNGPMTIQRKFKTSLKIKENYTMYIVLSNNMPDFENDEANRRRCILCKFPPLTDETFIQEAGVEMANLMPQFAGYCIEQAKRLATSEGIKCDYSLFDKVTVKPESIDPIEEWASALDTFIEPNVHGTVRAHTLVKIVRENCLYGRDKYSDVLVKEVIERVFALWGCAVKKTKKEFGYVYEGIQLKPIDLKNML